eukprot:PhM_4_TR15032/c0_g1_i1/m.61479/K07304/msrA; peptide-methionine (S)-S-oxide reductase
MKRTAFGAGCFWGTEKFFRREFGSRVQNVSVGYMGGAKPNPTYEDVCTGTTGHAEVFYVEYNPAQVDYKDLVRFFFRMHDPTTANRQGNDRGTQYRSAIFVYDDEQRVMAKEVMAELASRFPSPIVTTVEDGGVYYKGEGYHQQYLEANPGGYCMHKLNW